jgi:hypothetical protein
MLGMTQGGAGTRNEVKERVDRIWHEYAGRWTLDVGVGKEADDRG